MFADGKLIFLLNHNSNHTTFFTPAGSPQKMTQALVNSNAVKSAQLLAPRSFWSRPYTLPFTFIYPIYLNCYLFHYDTYFGGKEWTFIITLGLVSLHALVWLLPRWNLNIRARFNYKICSSLHKATHIMVIAKPNFGLSEVCQIQKTTEQISFKYQKREFIWNKEKGCFSPPIFFVDNAKLTIGELKRKVGLKSSDLEFSRKKYGKNIFDIPVPTFMELFIEHALAPFFVFQVFSIALWMMDEMWYLSLFSLFMLFSFEATTVYQRKSTMTEFQSMGIKPYKIYAYRDRKWKKISTDDLMPEDIVSIVRTPQEDLSIPCDLILLAGSCIVNEAMLSGESTPLLKESIRNRESEATFMPTSLDKNSLLHGGTSCLQVTPPEEASTSLPLPPDGGAIALVTKTGFETIQGSLVRVMIFSSERMTVANRESLFFILFLLVFAVIASRYVWIEGTRMGRVQSKLILDCIIVITSVVPPELPMELTMAVNQSLASLAKHYIYCTEPFRIPLAGRIDVCCFDKTGTLTAEDLVFEGLAGLGDDFSNEEASKLVKCSSDEVPETTLDVMGSTHALVRLDNGDVVGDPMEKETLKASEWMLSKHFKGVIEGHHKKIHVLKHFQFSSSLKRSSVISKIGTRIMIGCKGAPETIAERLSHIPTGYEKVYKSFTRSGSRVLALSYKFLDNERGIDQIDRAKVESGLTFAGFMVFHCPMKTDAIETINMLNQSSHRSVMITGDNPLTACHVAREVGIAAKPIIILDKPEFTNVEVDSSIDLEWRDVEETNIKPASSSSPLDISMFGKYDICVTGYAIQKLQNHRQFKHLIRHAFIYSRVSPSQKELIVNGYKSMSYNVLMCGDGTNDVGALKQAHVGIALLNGTESSLKKLQEKKQTDAMVKIYDKQRGIMARWGRPPPKVPVQIAHLYPPGPLNPYYISALQKRGVAVTDAIVKKVEVANRQPISVEASDFTGPHSGSDFAEQLISGMQMPDEQEAPALKLGDASVAAPFTSKLSNVNSVVHVIRQGRVALVSTIQMYKILALNCLISAYSLSVLYLAGIKFGDFQATVSGLLLSVCFLSISKGKPLEKLSRERPQPGIFNTYIMGSILGQFAIHLIALVYLNREIYILEPREPQIDLDKTFEPSLLNTAMFLLQLSQQVATFAANYIGRPFRDGLTENKGMYYGMLGVIFMCISGATEFIPEFNSAMQFVPMTFVFKVKLNLVMFLDFALSWLIEIVFKHFFMDYKASDIAVRDVDEVTADSKTETALLKDHE